MRKQIENYPKYEIDEYGNIYSNYAVSNGSKRILRSNGNGYLYLRLSNNGVISNEYVHRLVAKTFIPNPDNKPEINHMDGNKSNNHVSNLEWCTSSENKKHAIRTGLKNPFVKVNQYDMNDNFIASFPSVLAATIETGITKGAISNCLNGRKQSVRSYKWKYVK